MSVLTRRISEFVRDDFHALYYAAVAGIAALAIYANYYYGGRGLNIEKTLYGTEDPLLRLFGFFSLYLLFYLACLLVYSVIRKDFSFWSRGGFYVRVLLVFALLALMRAHTSTAVDQLSLLLGFTGATYQFMFMCLSYVVPLVCVTAVLYLIHRFMDHGAEGLYGLGAASLKRDAKAFLPLFLLIVPLVLFGMLTPGMAEYYPIFRDYGFAQLHGLPQWSTVVAFETSYAMGFVTVEMIFRGFLTLGMAKELARNAVVPMALVYCVAHFGKPVGECISSLFGGYLLGVVAYRYKSIVIGILLHLSLAMSMELVSWLARFAGLTHR